MNTWPALLLAAGAGAAVTRRRLSGARPGSPRVGDLVKTGQLFALAADWLRSDDTASARALLELVGPEGWRFAHDEVVSPSRVPRIAAMAGRMSAGALLATPPGIAVSTDRLAQIETLNAVATEIRIRMRG